MIRTSVWFVKWGTIFAALAAGLGWAAGDAGGAGLGQAGGGGAGIMSLLSGLVMDAINGQNQNAAGGARARPNTNRNTKNANTKGQSGSRGTRPKAWESFQQHNDWQYQENANGRGAGDLNEVLQGIMGSVMGGGGWMDAAKNAWNSVQNAGVRDEDEGQDGRKPPRQATTKAKSR